MKDDSCMENCIHFAFTDPQEPYGYGSNWWCGKSAKRIKKASKKCEHHVDRLKKNGIANIEARK